MASAAPFMVSYARPRTTSIASSASFSSSTTSSPIEPTDSPYPHVQHVFPDGRRSPQRKHASTSSAPHSTQSQLTLVDIRSAKSSEKPVPTSNSTSTTLEVEAETPQTASLVLMMKGFSMHDAVIVPASKAPQKHHQKILRPPARRNSEPPPPSSGLSTKLKALELQPPSQKTKSHPSGTKRTKRRTSQPETIKQKASQTGSDTTQARPSASRPSIPTLVITTSARRRSISASGPSEPVTRDTYRRARASPASSTSSSSPTSLPLRPIAPSPIPSFPPWTPLESPVDDLATIFHPQPANSGPTSVITPSHPSYFIVPSTCDKRRRTTTGTGARSEDIVDPPLKKRKQANGRALPSSPTSRSSSGSGERRDMLMPTAIDVVDFIKAKGGQCHEGDIFFRFRTGESEHVRATVNVIIEHFAVVDTVVGQGGRRRVTLRRGLASASSPVDSP